MAVRRNVIERLLEKIEKTDGCWKWKAAHKPSNGGRYALFHPAHGKEVLAIRPIYEHFIGKIPEGLVPDHLCKNASCVNPYHIELVTVRENILRGNGTGANYARRTSCEKGHEYTPENTRITKAGARLCRICRREANKEEKIKAKLKTNGKPV